MSHALTYAKAIGLVIENDPDGIHLETGQQFNPGVSILHMSARENLNLAIGFSGQRIFTVNCRINDEHIRTWEVNTTLGTIRRIDGKQG